MAVFDLSGGGVQALTDGVTGLFVDVLVFGNGISTGNAIPVNYYGLGLLRLGWHGAYRQVIPIDAATMFITCPSLTDALGYSLLTVTSIRVTEDFTKL
jgi:hypothetical protein